MDRLFLDSVYRDCSRTLPPRPAVSAFFAAFFRLAQNKGLIADGFPIA
ncbi:hypothetical protein [Bradyrhizobium sp.]